MACCPGVTRRRVAVRCATCGATVVVYLTITTLTATPRELHLRVVPDGDDLVMLRLMQGAHRGPFVQAPA